MTDRPLIILQVGFPSESIREVHGDIPSWFCRAIQHPLEKTEVVRVFEGEALPPPDASRVAVITGSWAMVTDRLPGVKPLPNGFVKPYQWVCRCSASATAIS